MAISHVVIAYLMAGRNIVAAISREGMVDLFTGSSMALRLNSIVKS